MLVRELLSLDALQPISSVTGEEGLDNAMKDVVLLEYDSLQQPRPKDYYLDDFIISTLFSARNRTIRPRAILQIVPFSTSLPFTRSAKVQLTTRTLPGRCSVTARLYSRDARLTIQSVSCASTDANRSPQNPYRSACPSTAS